MGCIHKDMQRVLPLHGVVASIKSGSPMWYSGLHKGVQCGARQWIGCHAKLTLRGVQRIQVEIGTRLCLIGIELANCPAHDLDLPRQNLVRLWAINEDGDIFVANFGGGAGPFVGADNSALLVIDRDKVGLRKARRPHRGEEICHRRHPPIRGIANEFFQLVKNTKIKIANHTGGTTADSSRANSFVTSAMRSMATIGFLR